MTWASIIRPTGWRNTYSTNSVTLATRTSGCLTRRGGPAPFLAWPINATPAGTAEHVLTELGYPGAPDKRLLDPACGSGTFLVMAINRIRRWYDEHRES